MSVSLGRLQQLITVARCGSFSRAAEELNVSQPALSRSIAALERRYGVQIFNRIGGTVGLVLFPILTSEFGLRALPYAGSAQED